MSKRILSLIVTLICSYIFFLSQLHAEDQNKPAPSTKQETPDRATDTTSDQLQKKPTPQQDTVKKKEGPDTVPLVKKDLGGAEIYFDITHLNLFDYGLGFVFGFDDVMYGVNAMLGYRHLNTFTGFPGTGGGTCAALDLFVEGGASIASVDGKSVVGGFLSLTAASNILWFKSLAKGNYDRSGNGIFIGAKIEAAYTEEGFSLGYGPAIGWTTLYYNVEKNKFRATNLTLFFYPPTMVIGLSITTNF